MTRVMVVAAGALAVLSAVKFLYLLAEGGFDIAKAPVVFLVPIVAIVVGGLLVLRGRRSGVWLLGVVALGLLIKLVSAIVQRGLEQQNWADALLVFAGVPLSILVLVAVPGAVRQSDSRSEAHSSG
ncbi:MAG TPA: hypothetical protein VFD59_12495 [Nocardioidaceae bacterium]|nr:hypothetical protein [Nocardioidaceae bacterium]